MLNFKGKALGVSLYVGHATQPYINSQSQHEAFVQAWERARRAVDHTQTAAAAAAYQLSHPL